jgi:hypothetical protein
MDTARAIAFKRHEEGLTKAQDGSNDYVCTHCDKATPHRVCPACKRETYKQSMLGGVYDAKKRSRDVLPIPIKTSNLVPMPAGENNEVSYAPSRARDRGRFMKTVDGMDFGAAVSDVARKAHVSRDEAANALKSIGWGKWTKTFQPDDAVETAIELLENHREGDSVKGTDAKAILPLQNHGSEFKSHMLRANQYEIAGDRARALDSYRLAASGYRRANDRINEAKAHDGIAACQMKFAHQYDHPGKGQVKVCDSATAALRTALERTRAGEVVSVDGMTVRPFAKARAADAAKLVRFEAVVKMPVRYSVVGSQKEEIVMVPVNVAGFNGKIGSVVTPRISTVAQITGKTVGSVWAPDMAKAQEIYDQRRAKDEEPDATQGLLAKARRRLERARTDKDADTVRAMKAEIARLENLSRSNDSEEVQPV